MARVHTTPIDFKRQLSALNNSRSQIGNNALYQVIKNLIDEAQKLAYEVQGVTEIVQTIDAGIDPSATVEDLDGVNDPGVSNDYSRGDHKHGISEYLTVNRTIVDLTNANVKALPTTPIDIVPAQGVGTYVIPFFTVLQCQFNFGAYTNVDATLSWIGTYINNYSWFSAFIGNDSTIPITFLTTFLGATDSVIFLPVFEHTINVGDWGNVPGGPFVPGGMENEPLQLYADNNGAGNFTGGHASNVAKATTLWTIVDL